MKQTIMLMLLLAATITLRAQEFNGIKISGTMENFISQAKAKGFIVTDRMENSAFLEGRIGVMPIELLVFHTPKSKQVYKVTVYLPKRTNWADLKADYKNYLRLLTDKYGAPSTSYDFFSDPYDEGDGYELTGVGADKCVYKAFWINKIPNLSLGIEISTYKQVKFIYENKTLTDLRNREVDQIETNAF